MFRNNCKYMTIKEMYIFMHKNIIQVVTLTLLALIFCTSCQTGNEIKSKTIPADFVSDTMAIYRGYLYDGNYDSIVNVLTVNKNETFTLWQLDRIAEHELNEREHEGIYSYLQDSSEIGLLSMDGILMFRFRIVDDLLIPLNLDGHSEATYLSHWKLKKGNPF